MLPSFMIIGAAKAGTTSLYNYLAEHPEIFMSVVKEPNFFALADGRPNVQGPLEPERVFNLLHRKTVTDRAAYEQLFQSAGGAKAVGEASPRYLYSPLAPAALQKTCGSIRLIAILRDPFYRAWSHFEMNRRRGLEPLADFAAALEAEPGRIAQSYEWDWHYLAIGRYAEQLERYIERFGRERLLVLLHEDLAREPAATLERAYRFVGVDTGFRPALEKRHHEARTPGKGPLAKLAFSPEDTALGRLAMRVVPPKLGFQAQLLLQRLTGKKGKPKAAKPDLELRRQVATAMSTDLDRLERLIDRDLSAWRAG